VAPAALDVRLPEADDALVDAHEGGVNADELATLPVPSRYQLATGSPIHSPMVTAL
jgi:hypothetical protein